MSDETVLRLFVSSPGDVRRERDRIDAIVERLNDEYAGRVAIRTIRWETHYYSSHDTFQAQIPEAAECDLVVAIFGARLGSPLPAGFPAMPSGGSYPSGTAYEVLTAIEARRRGRGIPDIYVFRRPDAPLVALDAADRAEVETQWRRLGEFFETWFRTRSGEFIAAFQEFSSTDEFAAKVEDCLRQWLARRGFPPEPAAWDRARRGSPYPGLVAFDESRRAVFFGRRIAVEQALRRLRDTERDDVGRVPFVLLIGASGSGKSSLLRAGLLPRVVRPGVLPEIDLLRPALVVPGRDPFAALAEALLAEPALGSELATTPFRDGRLLAKQLAADTDVAIAPIAAALAVAAEARRRDAGYETARPARLFLAIDQAERLLIETAEAERRRFAALVAALCRRRLATVFMVLRSDAYSRFQAIDDFVALRAEGATLDLLPPTPSELEEMARRPAEISSPPLGFERRDGVSLATRLVGDARGGDALPLLQMTLARLAAAEAARGDGVLRHDDYRGLGEAVSETAGAALAELDDAARAALPALIVGLVHDFDTDPATGRAVPEIGALDRARFEAGRPERRALVETFVAHRLLTAEGDAGGERVRPTHESLLRIWPEAVAILDESAQLVRARAAIEPIARAWDAAPPAEKARHLDVSPALLEAAAAFVERFAADVPETIRCFVAEATAVAEARRAAEAADRERRVADAEAIARARSRLARVAAIGLAVALGLAAVAGWQWRVSTLAGAEATRQRDRAELALKAATTTAGGLVFDLAQKFRDATGVPKPLIRDILDRARRLQEQLIDAGEKTADLTADHAAALGETAETEMVLGDLATAFDLARRARDAYRDLAAAAPDVLRNVHGLARSEDLLGLIEAQRGHPDEAEAAWTRAEAAAEAGIARGLADPRLKQLTASILQDRGTAARRRGDFAAARAFFERGLALTETLARDRPDDLALGHNLAVAHRNIGDVDLATGALDAAEARFATASEIAGTLARAHPENSLLQRDFTLGRERSGEVAVRKGDLPGALAAFRDGQETALALAASDPANLGWQYDVAIGHREIGDVLRAANDPRGAAEAFRRALAIDTALIARDPGNDLWRRHFDDLGQRLAEVLAEAGDVDGARQAFRRAADFATATATAGADEEWRDRAMRARRRLAALAVEAGDTAAARTDLEALVALSSRAPLDRAGRIVRAGDLVQLGGVLLLEGEAERSVDAFDEADGLLRTAIADDPKDRPARGVLVTSLVASAAARTRLGRTGEAETSLRRAIDLCRTLADEDPTEARWPQQRIIALDRLGDVLAAAGERAKAIEAYRASLTLAAERASPVDVAGAMTREALAPLLEADGRPAEALAILREAIAMRRDLAGRSADGAASRGALHIDLGAAARLEAAAGDAENALAHWREGLALARDAAGTDAASRRDLAYSLFFVGSALQNRKDDDGATRHLAEALPIALDLMRAAPESADASRFAGIVARALGGLRAAAADRTGAFAAFVAARDADAATVRLRPDRPDDAARLRTDVDRIGTVAGEMLLAREFEAALAALDRATPVAPDQIGLDLVRGLALVFLDRTDEAEAVLTRHRGRTTAAGILWEREVAAAIDRLAAKGLVHPFLNHLEASFSAAR